MDSSIRFRHSVPHRRRHDGARLFRRYRVFISAGWLATLTGLLWMLFSWPGPPPASRAAPVPASDTTATVLKRDVAVNLPADDAPHANATEWWYYSGQLQTDAGERYSFHVATFVRQGTIEHTAFHGSLRDHQTGKHYIEQTRTEGRPAAKVANGFAFSHGPWQISGSGGKHALRMEGKGYALDLALTDGRPPVLHQAPGSAVAGLLDLGAAGKSYYTSRPRMQTEGTLLIDGRNRAVRGEVWFDHQWGDFEPAELRWNWFALQLDDGAELMLYELFERGGAPVLRLGSYIKDGQSSALGTSEFTATSRGSWKSKLSSVVYPMDWSIAVPGKRIDLKLSAVNRQSQFDARLTTLNVYWEGAVRIGGSHGGVGFLELNGYPPEATPARK